MLVSSIVCGRLITKTGKVKPYIVAGSIVLVVGFLILSHHRPRDLAARPVGAGMLLVGIGVGTDHAEPRPGRAEHRRAQGHRRGQRRDRLLPLARRHHRRLGARRRPGPPGAATSITAGLTGAGIRPGGLRRDQRPQPRRAARRRSQAIVRAAYGDATGHIFLISAGIAVVGVVAALLLKPTVLRSSLDLPATEKGPDAVAVPAGAPATKAPESDGRGAGPDSDGRGGPPKAAGLK